MSRKKFTSIHWRLVRFTVWICSGLSLLLLTVILLSYRLGLQTLLAARLFGIPLLILIPVLAVTLGTISGFIVGYTIKRRIEMLAESIMRFERGNFAYRVPEIGEDEIGLVGKSLKPDG